MADLQARERQLKERLTVLEGRLHRIEKHLEQPADKDWVADIHASKLKTAGDPKATSGPVSNIAENRLRMAPSLRSISSPRCRLI